jgi:hypothetical protein
MPTVFHYGPYRFYFFSHDRMEPPHVHVARDDHSAKFWIAPVRLDKNIGFSRFELRRLTAIVEERKSTLLEAWNEYFGA